MIYLTGDLHGDFRRLSPERFREQEVLSKEDILLACGDFGGVWYGDERDDEKLDWLESRPFTTAFVTGNHENYDALQAYPLKQWRGGAIRRIRPSVILLERGQVFNLCGKRFFTMGGASSHDIQDGILEPDDPLFRLKQRTLDARDAMYRVNHLSWWKEELPRQGRVGGGLHHHPLLSLQCAGCVQRRPFPEGQVDRFPGRSAPEVPVSSMVFRTLPCGYGHRRAV